MENTNIAWAHDTQNFWVGCDQIAPECAHCYIDRELPVGFHHPVVFGNYVRPKPAVRASFIGHEIAGVHEH